ncbi:hypothetical protein ACQ4PT_065717 [Festuca glaucescens]
MEESAERQRQRSAVASQGEGEQTDLCVRVGESERNGLIGLGEVAYQSCPAEEDGTANEAEVSLLMDEVERAQSRLVSLDYETAITELKKELQERLTSRLVDDLKKKVQILQAFDEAIAVLDSLDEESFEVFPWILLYIEPLALWISDDADEGGDEIKKASKPGGEGY